MGYEIPALIAGLVVGAVIVYAALKSLSAGRAIAEAGRLATQMFEAQKTKLEDSIRKAYDSLYESRLAEWKSTTLAVEIKQNRTDAVDTSRAVMKGKIGEQMAPMISEFQKDYNPADARFIGSPIDYLIFNNMSEGKDSDEPIDIILLDIKTGKSGLNAIQKKIKAAADAKRIDFRVLRFDIPEGEQSKETTISEELQEFTVVPIENISAGSVPTNSLETASRKGRIV